jgi:hypothetical protein
LNAHNSTFSIRKIDRIVPANVRSPDGEVTRCSNVTLSGGTNHPAVSPTLIRMNATNAMERFPAGPAAAMSAARFGYLAAQCGSYGVLAQPIAQPCVNAVSSGTTSMPSGSRLMCGMGESVTWPP